ncbi:MAG TPA: hypothetical protein VE988_30530 [Gemmataceae bacterium]|nr:hypothetical protein [Gemmataceae bacterium]
MICHYCTREAARKCVSCGLAICSEHGNRYCHVCSGAVFSKDALTGEREEKGYLQCPPRPEMPTIYIDDDGPPECYRCQALARKVCQNCHNLFCLKHGGNKDWCDRCTEGARTATWVMTAIICAIVGLSLLFFLLSQTIAPR